MNLQDLIKSYVLQGQVTQLATIQDGKPWVCTVLFDADENLNLYWVSDTDCRHSQEISNNPQAAAAVAIKTDWPVVGLQFEGVAGTVDDDAELERALKSYAKKHDRDEKFVSSVIDGSSGKKVYRLMPDHIQLFSPKDFPDEPKQEWRL
ncbi:MAG TPA: pyridoxamine 5'-phosphate oxidase family protein [Candidatus Saccharimonadales bacterium]|nr:pyridoxamine 5'-phosphate oxidase family protein [Candidatus Saccharimonadales bacterium]